MSQTLIELPPQPRSPKTDDNLPSRLPQTVVVASREEFIEPIQLKDDETERLLVTWDVDRPFFFPFEMKVSVRCWGLGDKKILLFQSEAFKRRILCDLAKFPYIPKTQPLYPTTPSQQIN